MIEVIV